MNNLEYLFAGYASVWLGIVVYVRSLGRRQRALEEELEELRQKLR